MEPDRKTSGFCKAGSRKRFRLVFFGPGAIPRRARIRRNQTRDPTPHHHPLPVEGRPQPTRLRSVARTARARPALRTESDTHDRARRSGCVSRRGSGQPAPPAYRARFRSAGCTVCPSQRAHTRAAPSAPRTARIHSLRSGRGLMGADLRAGRVGPSQRRTTLWQVGCCVVVLTRGPWWGAAAIRDPHGEGASIRAACPRARLRRSPRTRRRPSREASCRRCGRPPSGWGSCARAARAPCRGPPPRPSSRRGSHHR